MEALYQLSYAPGCPVLIVRGAFSGAGRGGWLGRGGMVWAGVRLTCRGMTDVLHILADSTGGTAVVDTNDLRPAVAHVFQESQS